MLGHLDKMRVELDSPVNYFMRLDEQEVPLNDYLGKTVRFEFKQAIHCSACGKKTKKSYSQGHCFVCMKKLARCDMCILKPETCHFAQGTCREPEWGEQHCMIPHYVYLSNTSGLKVGITRENQLPTRWIDQGATQALAIAKVSSRHVSGLLEIAIAEHVADKTNWRAMLKGEQVDIDLSAEADRLLETVAPAIEQITLERGAEAIELLAQRENVAIDYPVLEYPSKITSFNLDKAPLVEGTLMGIKGQYLLLDTGVINIRKFSSYQVEWQC
ncbi:DUF2797 domain-containing protein [Aliagarivorans taiwanensis]|uniref:DUF2797 domain-containing protein n=1 Tax=Aliagarivorans taiwanensis TaxID=561966 RepID=UPI00042A62FE|nr:DUF2797 domain-containing protein [Aliagarivorans taiwanensis]